MRIPAAGLLCLALASTSAQWSAGGSVWVTGPYVDRVRFGPMACATLELDDRWRVGAALGVSLPTHTKVDRVVGGPRLLATGPTEPQHEIGKFFDTDRYLELSMTMRAGRGNRARNGHAYGGLSLVLLEHVQRWNYEVTILDTGERFRSRGSLHTLYYGPSTVIGYRTRERKGRFFAEARGFLLHGSGKRQGEWQLRYGTAVGFLLGL